MGVVQFIINESSYFVSNELNVDDLILIDGEISFLTATVIVLIVLGGTAVVSFVAGAIYEAYNKDKQC